MKQGNIEERKARLKKESVYGILIFVALQLICAVSFGSLCFIPDAPTWLFWTFLGLAVFCLLLVIPALIVLKQRFKEIEGGEWDAAGKY